MWQWDVISIIPFASVPVFGIIGRFDIVFGAIGIVLAQKAIKYASQPYLKDHKWLQRPQGACNCGAMNTGGPVGGRPGFPSGHAAVTSFIVVTTLLSYPQLRCNFIAWVFGVILIVLVDISRIKKKCHTLLQVVTGTLFGVTCALGLQALRVMRERRIETS